MTAPLRRSGMLVEHIERGCEDKVRYTSEIEARAAGLFYHERSGHHPQWLYHCRICLGFHLTRSDNGPKNRVTN